MGIIERRLIEGFICGGCHVELKLPKPVGWAQALNEAHRYKWDLVKVWKGHSPHDYFCPSCRPAAKERYSVAQKKDEARRNNGDHQ